MLDGTSDLTDKSHDKPHWARLPDGDTEYSDWQIDVKFIKNTTQARDDGYAFCDEHDDDHDDHDVVFSYLVHRYTVGPQCKYFAAVFRDSNGFSESQKKRSIIEFPVDESGVNHQYFEDFLDFLYDARSEKYLEFEPNKGLAMLYFADYFGIETVREQALEFLLHKIVSVDFSEMKWLAKLYMLAESLSIEELQDAIAKKACNRLVLFSAFLRGLYTQECQREFVLRICLEYKKTDEMSHYLSSMIRACPDIFDNDLFSELTEKENMPKIDSQHVSLDLLQHEQLLGLDEKESDELTCLQRRCIDQLYDRKEGVWRFVLLSSPKRTLARLRGLKPAVIESLLLRTLECNNDKKS